MKNVKRLLAAALLFALMVTFVACGPNKEDVAEKTQKATTATTTVAGDDAEEITTAEGETTAKDNKKDKTNKDGQTVTSKKVVSGSTAKDNKKTQKKTQKKTKKTKKKRKPTLPKTIPGASSTVAEAIPRTTDKDGNPTPAFINSVKGFTLKLLNPWEGATVGTPIYESSAYVEQMVESEFGVTIEESGFYESYDATLTASLGSGNPQAHIYRYRGTAFAGYFDKNYMCDLTAGMKKAGVDFKDPWYDIDATSFFNINNKQVGFSLDAGASMVIYYNKAMIEKAKLTDPQDLVRKGTWTWDALITYSQKLNSSTVAGFMVMEGNPMILFKGMVASHGKTIAKVATGTSPTTNINDSTVKQCLTDLATWSKNGYVTFAGGDWTYAKEAFGTGKCAMIYGSGDILSAMSATDFNSAIGVVPFPKPSKAQAKYYSYASHEYPYFVPSTYKNEAAKIVFLNNEMRRQSYRFWLRDFVINNMGNFKGEDLDMLTEISYDKGNFASKTDWSGLCETGSPTTATIVSAVADNKQTAQGAIDSYGDQLAQSYADIWKNNKTTGTF